MKIRKSKMMVVSKIQTQFRLEKFIEPWMEKGYTDTTQTDITQTGHNPDRHNPDRLNLDRDIT